MSAEEELLTVGQAAARLGVRREAIHQAIRDGRLPAVRQAVLSRPQPIYLIQPADVAAYAARQAGRKRRGPKPRAAAN